MVIWPIRASPKRPERGCISGSRAKALTSKSRFPASTSFMMAMEVMVFAILPMRAPGTIVRLHERKEGALDLFESWRRVGDLSACIVEDHQRQRDGSDDRPHLSASTL